jgi:adenylate kinase
MRLIINLIGTAGSGKGTQGQKLSQYFNLPHISVGDLFRNEALQDTELAKLNALFIERQNYAPDEICLGMVSRRLAHEDCERGFILDGFPRTPIQATVLARTFLRPTDIHIPIYMDLNEDTIKLRIQKRLICLKCNIQVRGHDVNTGLCQNPVCENEPLVPRIEDIDKTKLYSKFAIFNRYKDEIYTILNKRDIIHVVPLIGDEPIEEVFSRLFAIIQCVLDSKVISTPPLVLLSQAANDASNPQNVVKIQDLTEISTNNNDSQFLKC